MPSRGPSRKTHRRPLAPAPFRAGVGVPAARAGLCAVHRRRDVCGRGLRGARRRAVLRARVRGGGGCAAGFTCETVTGAGAVCLPDGGACTCQAEDAGARRPCYASNEDGTCWGAEICTPPGGWSGCDAPEAIDERCNGLDDDCDGLVDEDLEPGGPCENEVEGVGTCAGTTVCRGESGWGCSAPEPAVEICDCRDNDRDGAIDDGFLEGGAYVTASDCGVCGNDCAGAIANGAATVGEVASGVRLRGQRLRRRDGRGIPGRRRLRALRTLRHVLRELRRGLRRERHGRLRGGRHRGRALRHRRL